MTLVQVLDQEVDRTEEEKHRLGKCGECGQDVGSVHKCPVCNKNMHGFCGVGIGEEGFGQLRKCTKHDDNERKNDEDDMDEKINGGNDDYGSSDEDPETIPAAPILMHLEDAPEKVSKRKHDEVYDQFDITDGIGKDVGKQICTCKCCKKVVQKAKVKISCCADSHKLKCAF